MLVGGICKRGRRTLGNRVCVNRLVSGFLVAVAGFSDLGLGSAPWEPSLSHVEKLWHEFSRCERVRRASSFADDLPTP